MTILPPAVLTTTQLVGGLVASAKNALDLAKASSDHALKGAVSELYDSLLDVKARVLDLDEENRRLKSELARKDEFVGPIEPHGYFFYKDKLDQPLCPKCLQSQPQNPVFLSPIRSMNGGNLRQCHICHWQNYETAEQPSEPIRMGRANINDIRHRRP
ncbi:MAG TPA: hypothetical protein VN151_08385 [Terracidiphilus sp.]|nr:hypothetical protein [Terracidiphilus sp.]